MMAEHHSWISNRVAAAMAVAANGAAWLHSAAVENLSVGTVVTAFTTILIAGVSGAIYAIKNLGPVWIQFKKDLHAADAETLAGQMERLNHNLEDKTEQAEASDRLANILKDQVDGFQSLLEAMKVDLRKVNEKLHVTSGEANGYKLAREACQHELETTRRDFEEYKARLGPVIEKAEANEHKIDDLQFKVDKVGIVLSEPVKSESESKSESEE